MGEVIDNVFARYWADYEQMTPDARHQSVLDESRRTVAEADARYSESDA